MYMYSIYIYIHTHTHTHTHTHAYVCINTHYICRWGFLPLREGLTAVQRTCLRACKEKKKKKSCLWECSFWGTTGKSTN